MAVVVLKKGCVLMINNFKHPLLIYNPQAGGGKARIKFSEYMEILGDAKLFDSIDVYETKSPRDGMAKISETCLDRKHEHDLIITIGGDGTISEAVNGLMQCPKKKRLPLFPLPLGSGNSLLRDFENYTIEDAVNHYLVEKPRSFDLMDVKNSQSGFSWYCINVLGMGFIRGIADYVVEKGKKLGGLSYPLGTILTLKNFPAYNVTIDYIDKDDKKQRWSSEKVYFLTFSNTKFTGGAIKIAPTAEYNDGLFDVVALHDINRFDFLRGFVKSFKGNHITQKGCQTFQAKSATVTSTPNFSLMPDGELDGDAPIDITIVQNEVYMIV
jgi:diacylglycerol kinase (ATP)